MTQIRTSRNIRPYERNTNSRPIKNDENVFSVKDNGPCILINLILYINVYINIIFINEKREGRVKVRGLGIRWGQGPGVKWWVVR
jgi:hypothetical protein